MQELEDIDVADYSGNLKERLSWTALSWRCLVRWIDVGSLIEAPLQEVIVADANMPEDREPIAFAVDVVTTCYEDLEHFARRFDRPFRANEPMRR